MVANRNCENFIGACQVPIGVAGPIKIRISPAYRRGRDFGFRNYQLPLATTEGALVASVNRGCKATRLSGGINTYVENVGATRAPLFKTQSVAQSIQITDYIQNNLRIIGKIAAGDEPFIKLLAIKPIIVGRNLWLRVSFDTYEAMGMNMVTIASQCLVDHLIEKFKIKCLSLSGNLCVDKKPSWMNFIEGRGKRVWAEAIIKKNVLAQVLKTSATAINDVVWHKQILGSALSGSQGLNGHFANIVAALFLATGQDLGHVVDGSLGVTSADIQENGDLYFSVYLPDLMVGTIGGGTGLPTQKEALSMLGLDKVSKGDSQILAQIVAAACLAGELSLTAALAGGQLARAHQRLGRGEND